MRPVDRLRRLLAQVKARDVSDVDARIASIDVQTGQLMAEVEQNLRQRRKLAEQQGRVARKHDEGNGYEGRRRNGGAASPA